jgi:hypothetical protein
MRLPSRRKPKDFRKKPPVYRKKNWVLVLFFFILLLGAGAFFLKQKKSSILSGNNRPGIVLATSPILFLSFTPGEDLSVVAIPENTYLELTRGFGFYRIKSSWGLGEIEAEKEKNFASGQLLKETTQDFLGVPVDGWLGPAEDSWEVGQTKEDLEALKSDLTSIKIFGQGRKLVNFLGRLKTNLSYFDLVSLWWNIKNTRFDKVSFINLGQTKAAAPLVLVDKMSVLAFDQKLLDSALLGLFKDKKIVEEDLTVEILNSTHTEGLGQRASRVISGLGGEVVSIGNLEKSLPQSQIRAPAKILSSYTASRLSKIFGTEAAVEDSPEARADIQLILGEDYARIFVSSLP